MLLSISCHFQIEATPPNVLKEIVATLNKPRDSIAMHNSTVNGGVACESHINSIQLAVINKKFVLL